IPGRRDRDFPAAAAHGLARVLGLFQNRRPSRADRGDSLFAAHVREQRAREEVDRGVVREAIAPEDQLSADSAVLAGGRGARQTRHHVLRGPAEDALGRLANAQLALLGSDGHRRKQQGREGKRKRSTGLSRVHHRSLDVPSVRDSIVHRVAAGVATQVGNARRGPGLTRPGEPAPARLDVDNKHPARGLDLRRLTYRTTLRLVLPNNESVFWYVFRRIGLAR